MRQFSVGNAFPMGASPAGNNAIQFVCKNTGSINAGLVLYEIKTGKKEVFLFQEEHRIGNVYSLKIEGICPKDYSYNFISNEKEELDPYAKIVMGNEIWGKRPVKLSAGILLEEFNWEKDRPLYRPFEECIFYQLHVRGFTRHSSSGVKKKGTFEGIMEKIPYLKELGINTLELMPAYEFTEQESGLKTTKEDEPGRLNYWGFKKGAYFAPKSSYAGEKRPDISFKKMVKELHREGIEVIMQFYFPPEVSPVYIAQVLRFWTVEYHVDGFRLMGVGIPVEFFAADPVLYNTKLLYESFEPSKCYADRCAPVFKTVATYNDEYMYALRHFLKGDVGSLGRAFEAMCLYSKWAGNMVYFTNYNSFTLKDMVSYDRKHNEENQEEGRDGNNYNVSWNCGVEGPSRRKSILFLRNRQMRNAITLLLFSGGTPVLLSGDEFGNSQNGNNNPYCQDNVISWLNWKELERNKEFFHFVKEMIQLRKAFPLLSNQPKEGTGRIGAEFPHLSYHGKEAWKLNWDESNEEAGGILFYSQQTYLYLCVNMHWQETKLALPNLPGNKKWTLLLDTSNEEKPGELPKIKSVDIRPRSVKLMTAKGSKKDFDESVSAF